MWYTDIAKGWLCSWWFADLKPPESKDELENEQAWEVVQHVALLNLDSNGGEDGGNGNAPGVICNKQFESWF